MSWRPPPSLKYSEEYEIVMNIDGTKPANLTNPILSKQFVIAGRMYRANAALMGRVIERFDFLVLRAMGAQQTKHL